MTNILLVGTVGVGKSKIIEETQNICQGLDQKVHNVSIGDVVKQSAGNAGIDQDNLMLASLNVQRTLISGGITEKAAIEALKAKDDQHLIIDTPLTLYTRHGVLIQTIDDLDAFAAIGREIDRVVVLIDDPRVTADNLMASHYTAQINEVLTWTTAEIMRAYDFAKRYTPGKPPIVIPRPSSRTAIVKILIDPDPMILYPIRPISAVVKLEQSKSADDTGLAQLARQEINEFDIFVQQCAITTTPIEIMGYAPSDAEKEHTFVRDCIFVRQAKILAGIYPKRLGSVGGDFEYSIGLLFAKVASMINERPNLHPFGHGRIPFMFDTLDAFKSAILGGKSEYTPLKRLANSDCTGFRYEHIEKVARQVA
ncbi:MAG: hypothetical protein HYT16_03050 [DPANN group archaeon]|nr:hypothetical protein [DPANN group archaeon]